MAKKSVTCICILISLSAVLAAEAREKSSQGNGKRTEADLVSNFFSELGNLFLDIDETLAIQTAPKIEFEGLVAQLLRPSNEQFSNVQENYRTLQRRLGSVIRQSSPPKSIYTDMDLPDAESQKFEEKSKQDFPARVPLSKVVPFKPMVADMEGNLQSTVPLDAMSNVECSMDILSNPFLEPDKHKECLQRLKRPAPTDDRLKRLIQRKAIESRLKNQLRLPFNADEVDTYQNGFFRRGGDLSESTPKPQGRILGDILYSESSFDRNLRQLLKDHGRWLLDNPLLTRWRKATSKDNSGVTTEAPTTVTEVSESSSTDMTPEIEPTQAYIPITTEYNTEIPVSQETYSDNKLPLKSASYYRLMNTDGTVGEEVELVLNPNLDLETVHIVETEEFKKPSSEGLVILAFTQDGIPLKLRIGPEIENPFRFLHKVLKSAGVSLNVPVESLDNIEPVGKEILKFGAGVLSRPTYYDLSNRDDLKTLLMTLKLKASVEPKL